jgi:flagellar biosynthesis protein FlhG
MIQKETLDQPFILTVISGKGGVGKSMTSVNTSEMLSNLGYRVALIDADIGLSNCATLLNEPVIASVTHWINGDCGLEDLPHDCGTVTLVTGSDEPGKYHFQPDLLMDALDQVTAHLAQNHDFIVIDTPAGAGEISLWALDRASSALLSWLMNPLRFQMYTGSVNMCTVLIRNFHLPVLSTRQTVKNLPKALLNGSIPF